MVKMIDVKMEKLRSKRMGFADAFLALNERKKKKKRRNRVQ